MFYRRIFWGAIIVIVSLIFIISSCVPTVEDEGPMDNEPATIRVAVLPIMDTLPMYVASEEGYFEENNINIEFIPVASAPERDQLVSAGQADAMVNEIVSTMFYNRDVIQVQTVRYARTATNNAPLFHILVSKQSGITDPGELKGVEIGISQGTIIEYLTDRILESQNFSAEEIKIVAVPKISDRMALLASGEIDAAMLPDPLSFLAVGQEASIIIDDSEIPDLSFSTITFRKDFIENNPAAVRGFLAALETATDRINTDPANYAGLLAEKNLVPPPILESYQINPFPPAGVPSQAQWDDVQRWVQEKGLLDVSVSYEESVTDAYLP